MHVVWMAWHIDLVVLVCSHVQVDGPGLRLGVMEGVYGPQQSLGDTISPKALCGSLLHALQKHGANCCYIFFGTSHWQ